MKLSEVSSQIFFREVDKHFIKLVSKDKEILRTSVAVLYRQSEKWDGQIVLKNVPNKEKELLYYIWLAEYLPEEFRCLYKLELEKKIEKKVPEVDRDLFLSFLETPAYLKIYLLESSRFFKTTEEFFGWLKQVRPSPKLIFRKKEDLKYIYNPINHSRIRGYRDKGSLGSQFIGNEEWIKDYQNSEEEEERNKLRKIYSDTAEIIKGFIQ